jgi:hypothetical protein
MKVQHSASWHLRDSEICVRLHELGLLLNDIHSAHFFTRLPTPLYTVRSASTVPFAQSQFRMPDWLTAAYP